VEAIITKLSLINGCIRKRDDENLYGDEVLNRAIGIKSLEIHRRNDENLNFGRITT
jgi:hypothetical protein